MELTFCILSIHFLLVFLHITIVRLYLVKSSSLYARVGQSCNVNEQLGFIKFGSRVDMYLPMDAEILVNMKQHVVGNKTIIAKLPQ